jgi:hypothetical protein
MIEHPKPTFKEWCVLELMGHRKLAGLVSEQEIAGHGFLRLDIHVPIHYKPDGSQTENDHKSTQFYSPSSVYAITPVSEDTARRFAEGNQPAPVTRWELPQLPERPRIQDFEEDPDEGVL